MPSDQHDRPADVTYDWRDGLPAGYGGEGDASPSTPGEWIRTSTTVDTPVTFPPRARTGIVVLVALIVELILVAGGGNQWVTDRLVRFRSNHDLTSLQSNLLTSAFTYNWRFSPKGGHDDGHFWLSQLVLAVGFLVLGTLLVIPAVRGVVTFWRAFFGTWFALLAATVAMAFVRGLIVDPRYVAGLARSNRLDAALFGPYGPTSSAVVAGAAMGLVVAIFTATLAVATRRASVVRVEAPPPAPPAPEPVPDLPPPFFGDAPAERTVDFGRPAPTDRLPEPPASPSFDQPYRSSAAAATPLAAAAEEQATSQLPAVEPPPAPGGEAPAYAGPGTEPDPERVSDPAVESTTRLPAVDADPSEDPGPQPTPPTVGDPADHPADPSAVGHPADPSAVGDPADPSAVGGLADPSAVGGLADPRAGSHAADPSPDPTTAEPDSASTARFPRPPDDEDLPDPH